MSSALLLVYILLGPVTWAIYGLFLHIGRSKMLLMRRPPDVVIKYPPLVSLIIPAKDEGQRIRACLESAIGQDYANFEVMAIDDRSTDQTGQVMDDIAANDPRLIVIHKTEPPPPGWTGKNNALWIGQAKARGDWLLFVDSDVILEKDAMSAAMAVVIRKELDMLSILPRLECHSLWESLILPLAGGALSTMYLIALTNNVEMPNVAFGNGQFLLISRAAYDKLGGHETVRDRFCEDIEIAVQLKKRGMRPRISWGNDFAAVRMYSSLDAIFRGWSRIYYAAGVGSPSRVLGAIVFLLISCFPAFAATAWGAAAVLHSPHLNQNWMGFAWLGAGLIHLAVMGHFLANMYSWCGNRRSHALLFPIGGPMLLAILLRALKMCITKKVEWRGTSYSHNMAKTLEGGKHIRIGAFEKPSGMGGSPHVFNSKTIGGPPIPLFIQRPQFRIPNESARMTHSCAVCLLWQARDAFVSEE